MARARRWERQGSIRADHGPSIQRAPERAFMLPAHRERGQALARGRDLAHRVRVDRLVQVARLRPAKHHARNAPPHGDVAEDLSIPRRRKAH